MALQLTQPITEMSFKNNNTQYYWGSGPCPSSGIKKLECNISKRDLFPSSGEGRKTPTLLGPLERANLNHWVSAALCKGPYRVDVFLPSPGDGNRSRFEMCSSSFYSGRWTKSGTPEILNTRNLHVDKGRSVH
jgi:hypothetical protein